MYKCGECDMVFSEPKRVLNGGGDIGEDSFECPHCRSDVFFKGELCPRCGGAFVEDADDGLVLCDECLKKHMTFDEVLRYAESEERPEEVPINALLANMFSPSEINTLLEREARNGYEISRMFPVVARDFDNRIAEFVGECKDGFSAWVAK